MGCLFGLNKETVHIYSQFGQTVQHFGVSTTIFLETKQHSNSAVFAQMSGKLNIKQIA